MDEMIAYLKGRITFLESLQRECPCSGEIAGRTQETKRALEAAENITTLGVPHVEEDTLLPNLSPFDTEQFAKVLEEDEKKYGSPSNEV